MNVYVDIPLLTYFPYILVGVVAAIVGGLIWVFYAKPRMDQALPNEEYCGILKIHLPQLGIFNVGPLNTAYNTVQERFGNLITNSEGEEKKEYIEIRDDLEKCHLFAQRTEDGEKVFYVCDENLLDPKFHAREDKPSRLGQTTPIRNVGQVLECISMGEFDGFTWIGVILGAGGGPLSDEARENLEVRVQGVKHARLAANSKEEIKKLKEQNDMLNGKCTEYLGVINKMAAEVTDARLISGMKDMSTGEPIIPGPSRIPNVREFFTLTQVIIAILGYFVAMNAMSYLHITFPEPNTIGILAAIGAYIFTPFVRKALNK